MTLSLLVKTLKSGLRLIIAVAVVAAILAAAFTIVRPAVFEARSTLLITPPASQAQPEGGGRLAAALLQQSSPLKVLEGVMSSQTAKERVWKALNTDEDHLTLIVSTDPTNYQFTISAQAKDRDLALNGTKTAIDVLATLRRELDVSRAGLQAKELSKALEAKRIQLKDLENEALALQLASKTAVNPNDPASVVIYKQRFQELKAEREGVDKELNKLGAVASQALRSMNSYAAVSPSFESLRQNVVQAEIELRAVQQRYRGDATMLREATAKAETAKKLLNAELDKYLTSIRAGTNPQVATLAAKRASLDVQIEAFKLLSEQAPQEALKLWRIQRDLQTMDQVYTRLKVEYESAMVEEKVANSWWSVLDAPYLLPKPINKSLGMATLLAGLGGAFFTILVLAARATLREQAEPETES